MSPANILSDSSTIAPAHTFNYDDAVALHVGPSEHVLLAHASYITRDSEFFKAALKKEWTEGQSRVIKLPEEQPHVVAHYLNYAYNKILPIRETASDTGMTSREYESKHNQLLAELYVLGERLLDDSIRFTILKKIIDIASQFTPINEAANIIYRGTTDSSPARRLLVDIQVKYGQREWLDYSCDAAFLLDVAQAFCSEAKMKIDARSRGQALEPSKYAL